MWRTYEEANVDAEMGDGVAMTWKGAFGTNTGALTACADSEAGVGDSERGL